MNDMLKTIEPKSDQLNSDDLIGQTKTIKVTKVAILAGDQPVALSFEGDNGKPYKPGKSMRRVLVSVWGNDANNYIGKSMTLYRDEKVTFGGLAVGGIRISHMSHIDKPITMVLTATRANKKPFTVQPLKDGLRDSLVIVAKNGVETFKAAWLALTPAEQKMAASYKDELKLMAEEVDKTKTTIIEE